MSNGTDLKLPETIAALVALGRQDRAERTEVVAIHDRRFIIDNETGKVTEILPRHEDVGARAPDANVRDLGSVVAWARGFAAIAQGDAQTAAAHAALGGASAPPPAMPDHGVVTIGASGPTRACWPAVEVPYVKRSTCEAKFYADLAPPSGYVGLLAFLEWYDRIRPGIEPADGALLDSALQTISAASGEGAKVEQSGAVINIATTGDKAVTFKTPMPKRFRAMIPWGDPGFVTQAEFSLTVKLDKGEVTVRCALNLPPITEAWVAYARDFLAEALPGWLILAGP